MKNYFLILFSLIFLLIGFSSHSQKKGSDEFNLIRKESKPWIWYSNKNYSDQFKPTINDIGYDLAGMSIDTGKIYSIVREIISSKHYDQLNKKRWIINNKLTSYGQIVSVSFSFKDESGVDTDEFAILAERIKKEIRWKLSFNKGVSDLFYMQLSIPGPKF